jgi:hypothetical protein
MTEALGGFATLLNGKHTLVNDQIQGPQKGTVIAVDTGAHRATATLEVVGDNIKYSDLAYCRTSNPPQIGDDCLILFIGRGIDAGWLVSWTPA